MLFVTYDVSVAQTTSAGIVGNTPTGVVPLKQTAPMPDVKRFRHRQRFQDPYENLERYQFPQPQTAGKPQVTLTAEPAVQRTLRIYNNQLVVAKPPSTSLGGVARSYTGKGFRIQIFMGTNDDGVRQRDRFMMLYPDVEVKSFFDRPDYKVRVGSFATREDAQAFLQEISKYFKEAFIVPD
jgi:hypothetical protein